MKIFYVINARMPTEKAHGIQIAQMCQAFSNLAEVELVLPRRKNLIKQDIFDYYGVKQAFKVTKLPILDFIIFDEWIGNLGIWLNSISFFISVFFYLLFRKRDIIYTRDRMLLPLALFYKNVFFEAHGFPKHDFLYNYFFKRAKSIIAITDNLRKHFLGKGINQQKIMVAPDAVDFTRFNIQETRNVCREKLGLSLGKKVVLYSGHLYSWKGASTLLEAARRFSDPDTLFVFVGGTEKDINAFREKAKGMENVWIVGHRPYQEIPYWLKSADVLIFPSLAGNERENYWTSPLKIFEYMVSGIPIISSDLPSVREVLNEKNVCFVRAGDSLILADSIKKVLDNPDFYDKISRQAFLDVQNYTWERRAGIILNFIEKAK